MDKVNSRAIAATTLSKVLSHQGSLGTQLGKNNTVKDFPLIQEICFGVCRHYHRIQAIISHLLDKPLRAKDLDIQCLLMVGIYQLFYMRVPDHATINETVNATGFLKKTWAKGLVNAVLRQCIKQRSALEKMLQSSDEETRFSHPAWLIAQLKHDWPDHWLQILHNNNLRAPMTLRVNLAKNSRDEYLEKLKAKNIEGSSGNLSDSAIYLATPCQVTDLPEFSQGSASVQDEASQLVPSLMNLLPGLMVLDACAAPGGKTAHMLESEQSLTKLVALDNSASRLNKLQENLLRLDLQADVTVADASQPDAWWDGEPFDRILLDAPCSATGVIRRHPDIKLLRRESDIGEYSDRQLSLLCALWNCLKPGGLLLYTTCSVLRLENDDTVQRFLHQHQSAKFHAITADWGVECLYGRQLLPDSENSDGFYFSLLEKSQGTSYPLPI